MRFEPMTVDLTAELEKKKQLQAEIARLQNELDLLKRDHASLLVMFNERSDSIGALQSESARQRAALERLRKLFAHIEGINDERDAVPILLEARRIIKQSIEK